VRFCDPGRNLAALRPLFPGHRCRTRTVGGVCRATGGGARFARRRGPAFSSGSDTTLAIHPTAVIHPQAEIDSDATIDAYVIIDGPVHVGAGTRVRSFSHLSGWTEIGRNCDIHPYACIGNTPQDHKYQGGRSYCRLGDGVTVREGVTIHRGTGRETATVIGDDCYLMGYAHVGHNCKIGRRVGIYQSAMLGGHVEIEDQAIVSANVAVHQFVRIGRLACLAANARITMDVPPFMTAYGESLIVAYNSVGLRRAGMASEEIREVKEGFRLLFRAGLPFRKALEQFSSRAATAAGRSLLEFSRVESQRGYCSGQPRVRHLRQQAEQGGHDPTGRGQSAVGRGFWHGRGGGLRSRRAACRPGRTGSGQSQHNRYVRWTGASGATCPDSLPPSVSSSVLRPRSGKIELGKSSDETGWISYHSSTIQT